VESARRVTSASACRKTDLKKHVKAHLAGYKVPRRVFVLDDLPRNDTGKALKRELGKAR
jgi:acyl-CoA synthetase (AMP-forming)/AMP-acid ligase II